MKAFEYVEPGSLDGVVERLSEVDDAMPLSGGMDLLGLMKDNVAMPDRLVSLKAVEGLGGIDEDEDGGLRLGALTSVTTVATDERIRGRYPALSHAAETVGTPQIRNRGTLGGNLCQRPRCWYFRSELFNCLKKGGDACFAQGGDNRYHAIFANDRCAIVHPSSCAPALVAYGASVVVRGEDGERTLPIEEFFVSPEINVRVENVLGPDEVLAAVLLPLRDGWRSATQVVKFKQSHDWPLAIASVAARLDGADVADSRVVLGAVAPIPWRSPAAEEALAGGPLDEARATAAADAALEEAGAMEHNEYKVRIAHTALKRAILAAGAR